MVRRALVAQREPPERLTAPWMKGVNLDVSAYDQPGYTASPTG